MLFLVQGEIRITQYEGKTTMQDVIRIVRADDAIQAEEKFRKHYEDMTDEYSVYYYVRSVEVSEEIS